MAGTRSRLAILLLLATGNRASLGDVHEGVEKFPSGEAKVSLEYFRPAAPGKFPAVFLLHGSGGLDPGTAYVFREIGRDLASQGYVVLIPHYFERTGHHAGEALKDNEFPSMIESVHDAIEFAVANAPVDSDRIGMIGYSMGAYIALVRSSRDPRIKAIVAVSAHLPVEWKSKFPALLILLGSGDRNTPPARLKQFEAIMKERQVPYGTHVYRGIAHNFDIPTWDDASRRAATFFNKFLKETKARRSTRSRTSTKANAPSAKAKIATAPKAGAARLKTGDASTNSQSPQPKPSDAQPKPAGPQPIFIDARPTAAIAQPKAGGTPTKPADSSTDRTRVDPPAGDQRDTSPPRS